MTLENGFFGDISTFFYLRSFCAFLIEELNQKS